MLYQDIKTFALDFNLFGRFKSDHALISYSDLLFTYIYFIIMITYPFLLIAYKLGHYNQDKEYCNKHKNVHSCRNISFPHCIFDIISNIFTLKLLIECILLRITNLINFVDKYDDRIMNYSCDKENKPDEITNIESF